MSRRPPTNTVIATAGQIATLPCFMSEDNKVPNVEWSKVGPSRSIIFFYMNGCEHLDMKNESFDGRTNMILKELNKGNISLTISYVRLTDAGMYTCMAKQKGIVRVLSVVKLNVVSDPILSVVPAVDDQVSLQCEVDYCSTMPDIKLLDHEENIIYSESPKPDRDSRGCSTSRIRATLQSPTKRVICRVHHSEINETKEKVLNIPACCVSCTTTTVIVGLVAALIGGCISMSLRKFKVPKKLSMSFTKSTAEDNAKNEVFEQLKAGPTTPADTEGAKRSSVVNQQDQSPTDKIQPEPTKPSDPPYDSSFKVPKTPQDSNQRQVTTANSSRPRCSTFPSKAFKSQAACSVNKPSGQHQSSPALPMSRSPRKCHILVNNPFNARANLTEEGEQLLK